MVHERRTNPRVEWHSPGKIYDCEGDWICPCVIKDLSNGGAKISGVVVRRVPDEFMLRIARGPMGTRKCHVLWRSAATLGVEFVDSLAHAEGSSAGRAKEATSRPAHA